MKRSIAQKSLSVVLTALVPFSLVAQDAQLSTPVSYEPVVDAKQSMYVAPMTPSGTIDLIPPVLRPARSPVVAGCLSSVLPGLGHYYLGATDTGSVFLGSVIAGGLVALATSKKIPSISTAMFRTTSCLSRYSAFAAYRDASFYSGNISPNLPREDLKQLAAASFQWSVIKKPEVWGGVLGSLALASTVMYFAHSHAASASTNAVYVYPLGAFPISVGEESLFRGFIQTALLEKMSPWGAITLSSLIFGAAHISNTLDMEKPDRKRYYTYSLPLITSLGAYMGWLAYKNHSLQESVAVHAWYDFTVFLVGAMASTASTGGKKMEASHSWEF